MSDRHPRKPTYLAWVNNKLDDWIPMSTTFGHQVWSLPYVQTLAGEIVFEIYRKPVMVGRFGLCLTMHFWLKCLHIVLVWWCLRYHQASRRVRSDKDYTVRNSRLGRKIRSSTEAFHMVNSWALWTNAGVAWLQNKYWLCLKGQKLASWWRAEGHICVWNKQGCIYNDAFLWVSV